MRSAKQKAAQLKAAKASAAKRKKLSNVKKMVSGGTKGNIQVRMQMDSSGKRHSISKKAAENMLPLNTLKSHRPGTVTSLSGRSRYKAKSKKK